MPISLLALVLALQPAKPTIENHTCGGAVEETDIRYHAEDGVPLAAAIIRPAQTGDGPVPALLLIQGSGTSDRNNGWARAFAEELASCGIAVGLTDKRGSGDSGGEWRTASFDVLARDAAAGLVMLESQGGIDPDRTGFLGLSQGGMIAPLAALYSGSADYLINVSGGVVPLEQSLIYELTQTYRQKGVPGPVAARLTALASASFDYLRDEHKWEDYLAIRSGFVGGEHEAAVESWPTEQGDPYWTFWKKNYAYDPALYWQFATQIMAIPSLAIFGAEDASDNVDVDTSVARFNQASHGAPYAMTAVYSDTGHLLVEKGKGRLEAKVIEQIRSFINRG